MSSTAVAHIQIQSASCLLGALYSFSIGALYALYGGWLMVLGYAVLLIVGIYENITKDVKRRRLRRNHRPVTYRRRVYQTANR